MAAVRSVRRAGGSIAQAHLRHLNPFPSNLGEVLRRYDKRGALPEMNLGQLALLLRGKFLVDVMSVTQVRGMPFQAADAGRHPRNGALADLADSAEATETPTTGSPDGRTGMDLERARR